MKEDALRGNVDCHPPCRATRQECVCNMAITASPVKAPDGFFGDALAEWLAPNLTDYGSVLAWLRDVDAKNNDVQISGGVSLSPSALRHFVYTEWARINGARGVRVRVGCSGVVWCIYDVPSVLRE